MQKTVTNKPLFLMLYGFPGAGKTNFARQIAATLVAAHIQADKIRHELFETPRYDANEDRIIEHLMRYMAEEFLRAGVSVVYDINAAQRGHRRALREIAHKTKSTPLLVWLQIDADSAMTRLTARDKRKTDDRYAASYTKNSFSDYAARMQNPAPNEEYVVASGKHTFNTQKSALMKKLYDMGLVESGSATANVVKPGLVNLIPNRPGRVDMARRNIVIK